jgi:hypothetical protein
MATRYFCNSIFDGFESGREGTSEQIKNWYSSRFFAALATSPIAGTIFLVDRTSIDKGPNNPCTPLMVRSKEVIPSPDSSLLQLELLSWRDIIELSNDGNASSYEKF